MMFEEQRKKEEFYEKMLSQFKEDAAKREEELEKKNKEMIKALENQKKDIEKQIQIETQYLQIFFHLNNTKYNVQIYLVHHLFLVL